MKKGFFKAASSLFIAAVLVFVFAACTTSTSDDTIAVTGVTLNKSTLSIFTGATEQLTATVAPADATNKSVTWTSSSTASATVSTGGLVTGVAAGTSTITVTTADGGKTATCAVTVSAPTLSDIAGSWVKSFPSPYFDYDGATSSNVADAMIFTVTGSDYSMIFIYETGQVGGNRGTIAISGNNLAFTPAESWGDTTYWQADTSGLGPFGFSLSGDILTLDAGTAIPLAKTVFQSASPAGLAGVWTGADASIGTATFTINADGTYSYTQSSPSYSESGTWSGSGTTAGYLWSLATTRDSTPVDDYSGFTVYALSGNTVVMQFPGASVTFTKP